MIEGGTSRPTAESALSLLAAYPMVKTLAESALVAYRRALPSHQFKRERTHPSDERQDE